MVATCGNNKNRNNEEEKREADPLALV